MVQPQGKAGADLKSHRYVLSGTDWIDQFNPAARELRWKYLNDAFFKIGTDSWWQDATEPGDDGNSMANHRVFFGSGDLYRNAYPLFANQTVYEGQRQASSEKRVVTLTRSAYPGQQRYATALWSGDIAGNWETLRRQIPAGLHVCLAGLPYWTTDCGGFFRRRDQYQSDDYADLLTRWFQYSTFCPAQRIHGYQSETEFWKFPRALDALVAYDRLRYRLLPYIYSVAWQVTHNGSTMMRALPMDFRGDSKVWDIDDEYMFGPALLVSPVVQPKAATRSVYLPAATQWTSFWTAESVHGGQRTDVSGAAEGHSVVRPLRQHHPAGAGPPIRRREAVGSLLARLLGECLSRCRSVRRHAVLPRAGLSSATRSARASAAAAGNPRKGPWRSRRKGKRPLHDPSRLAGC